MSKPTDDDMIGWFGANCHLWLGYYCPTERAMIAWIKALDPFQTA